MVTKRKITGKSKTKRKRSPAKKFLPRLVAWETTLRCNLRCVHCRAGADKPEKEIKELSHAQGKTLLRNIASLNKCVVILTGGEPLLREDIFELASYGNKLGLRMALATNGTLLDERTASEIKSSGIARVSLSLDGFSSAVHNDFRGQDGSFDAAIKAAHVLRKANIQFQVNSSFTRRNIGDIERLHDLVQALGAVAWHVFMVVPTGRAAELAGELLDKKEYEQTLVQLYRLSRRSPLEIKPTCAPQYYRVLRQMARREGVPVDVEHFGINATTRGCLAGQYFAFVSAEGNVLPCGYFPKQAGSLRRNAFSKIWRSSKLFMQLRNPDLLKGRCGDCEYNIVCGGCRARAYAASGDFLSEEIYCSYMPDSGAI
jgi:heme b synthase